MLGDSAGYSWSLLLENFVQKIVSVSLPVSLGSLPSEGHQNPQLLPSLDFNWTGTPLEGGGWRLKKILAFAPVDVVSKKNILTVAVHLSAEHYSVHRVQGNTRQNRPEVEPHETNNLYEPLLHPDCSLSSHSTSAGSQILILKQHQHHFVGLYNQCCQHLDAAVCWALFLQIRSVISSVHETADGHSVGKHQLVSRLLKQYLIQCLLLDLPINSQPGWSLVSSTRQLGYTLLFFWLLLSWSVIVALGLENDSYFELCYGYLP